MREHIGALDDIWKVPGSDIPVGAFCMGEQCEDVVTVSIKTSVFFFSILVLDLMSLHLQLLCCKSKTRPF